MNPLNLPAGSVRAILAIGTVAAAFVLFGIHELTFTQLEALTAGPLGLYFGQYIASPASPAGSPVPAAAPAPTRRRSA